VQWGSGDRERHCNVLRAVVSYAGSHGHGRGVDIGNESARRRLDGQLCGGSRDIERRTQPGGTVSIADGGVEVIAVEQDSPAAQRGLRAGDIITAVNRRPVRSLAELNEIASSNRILFLLVERGDRALMLQVR